MTSIKPKLRGELLRGFRTLFLAFLSEEERGRQESEVCLRAELDRLDLFGPASNAVAGEAEEYRPGNDGRCS